MLSETLANLTRRIAEEFDHLSDSDASPQNGGPSDPRLATAPQAKAPDRSLSQEEPCACTPESVRNTNPQPSSDAPQDEATRATGAKRRPAKKASATTADSDASSNADASSETPRNTKDWQRTVIN